MYTVPPTKAPPTQTENVFVKMEVFSTEMLKMALKLGKPVKGSRSHWETFLEINDPPDLQALIETVKGPFQEWHILESKLKVDVAKLSKVYRDLTARHRKVMAENNNMAKLTAASLNKLEVEELRAVHSDLAQREDSALRERFEQTDCFDKICGYGRTRDED